MSFLIDTLKDIEKFIFQANYYGIFLTTDLHVFSCYFIYDAYNKAFYIGVTSNGHIRISEHYLNLQNPNLDIKTSTPIELRKIYDQLKSSNKKPEEFIKIYSIEPYLLKKKISNKWMSILISKYHDLESIIISYLMVRKVKIYNFVGNRILRRILVLFNIKSLTLLNLELLNKVQKEKNFFFDDSILNLFLPHVVVFSESFFFKPDDNIAIMFHFVFYTTYSEAEKKTQLNWEEIIWKCQTKETGCYCIGSSFIKPPKKLNSVKNPNGIIVDGEIYDSAGHFKRSPKNKEKLSLNAIKARCDNTDFSNYQWQDPSKKKGNYWYLFTDTNKTKKGVAWKLKIDEEVHDSLKKAEEKTGIARRIIYRRCIDPNYSNYEFCD